MISGCISRPILCKSFPRNLGFAPNALPSTLRLQSVRCMQSSSRFSGVSCSWKADQEPKSWLIIREDHLYGHSQTIPKKPRWSRSRLPPVRASKDVKFINFRYPVMTEKPKWYWRAFASLFYLMPLHSPWLLGGLTEHQLLPFLLHFLNWAQPFIDAIGRLPSWYTFVYSLILFIGVVRKKQWPHFFRFHVVMALLLDSVMLMIAHMSSWMPQGVCCGNAVMKIWTAVVFAYVFTVMQSVLCALAGKREDEMLDKGNSSFLHRSSLATADMAAPTLVVTA